MKTVARSKRGQFVIIAALLIAVLTFSLVLSIHQINLQQQELAYNPVQELVLGITSDLERALNTACNASSSTFNATRYLMNDGQAKNVAINTGTGFMANWTRSILTAYANAGLNITMMQNSPIFDFKWDQLTGTTYASAYFSLDAASYGFQGYIGHSQKTVVFSIDPSTINNANPSSTTLHISLTESTGSNSTPIPNLTIPNINVKRSSAPGLLPMQWPTSSVTQLTYLGNGEYSLTFTPRMNVNTLGVMITVTTPNEGIMVEAMNPNQPLVTTTLQSQDVNALNATNVGTIQFGDSNYTLNNTVTSQPGTYLINYFPLNTNCVFINWTVNGYAIVTNPNSILTSVSVQGNNTITAFYTYSVIPQADVNLSSRDLNDPLLVNDGITVFNNVDYSLPNSTGPLALGNYNISYVPLDGEYFQFWETQGSITPYNSSANPTLLNVAGNGNLTAVYASSPPPVNMVSVTLQSAEATGLNLNLGNITLGTDTYKLPATLTVSTGSYLLAYLPVNGYVFMNWGTTENILLVDASSQTTQVTINGSGSITATYSACKVGLYSEAWDGSSQNLGNITLGSNVYILPPNGVVLNSVLRNDYPLAFTLPYNSTYVFLNWTCQGNIIPWNSTDITTTVTVTGDGDITAFYGPSQFAGAGGTLYVDFGSRPNTGSMRTANQLSDKWLHGGPGDKIPSPASSPKQELDSNSTALPTNYVVTVIKATAYVDLSQGINPKDVTLEVGFYYGGQYYKLGASTFTVSNQAVGVYVLNIDALDSWGDNWTQLPYGKGVIPAGSIFTMKVSVTFLTSPYGRFFLCYGSTYPSNISFL